MEIGQIVYVYVAPDVAEGKPGWFPQKWYRGIVTAVNKNIVDIKFPEDRTTTRLDLKADADILYVPSPAINNKDSIDEIVVVMLNKDNLRWHSGIIADVDGNDVNVLFDDGEHGIISEIEFKKGRAKIVGSIAEAEQWTVHRNTATLPAYSKEKAPVESMETLNLAKEKPEAAQAKLEAFFKKSLLDDKKADRLKPDLTLGEIYDEATRAVEPLIPKYKNKPASDRLGSRSPSSSTKGRVGSNNSRDDGNKKRPKRG